MFHHCLRNLKNACLKRNIRRKEVILRCIPVIQFLSNGMTRLPAHTQRSTGAQSWEGQLQLYAVPSPLSSILAMSPSKVHLHIHEGVQGLKEGGGAPVTQSEKQPLLRSSRTAPGDPQHCGMGKPVTTRRWELLSESPLSLREATAWGHGAHYRM